MNIHQSLKQILEILFRILEELMLIAQGKILILTYSHQSQNERHKSTTSLYQSEYGVLNLDTPSHISEHRINTDENTLVFKVEYEKRDNGFFPMSTWVKKDDLLRQSPRIYANYLDIHLEYAI